MFAGSQSTWNKALPKIERLASITTITFCTDILYVLHILSVCYSHTIQRSYGHNPTVKCYASLKEISLANRVDVKDSHGRPETKSLAGHSQHQEPNTSPQV
ncbi:hypothetical protein E2C01_044442 [Portunus trituberculatus]|uniref:Uncharacterized protein n=1 Tax=Portunus trituberculatus TaxID=210409 RepID=A0A5B7G031_PORTR|nr:hypothetical protein [Portunus trituberculatus]